ncbi:alpha/beta hydrolase [Paraglaciecola sp.]|uniref:alpha/beta hydrolase n=1 Tax=Paraglaciecola sp. TaxID=1920173 RepID=UPI003EFA8FEB
MLVQTLIAIVTILFLLSPFGSIAEQTSKSSEQIISGTWYDLKSVTMSETRRYSVHLPPSYSEKQEKNYPVLYVLDGYETRMRGVGGMIEALSYYDLSQQIPEFIIVAIPNTNRTRDLIPTQKDLIFKGKVLDKLADNSGGADIFATFIRQELFPRIESQFRTSKKRGILGMSFGGLFAAHLLLTQPDMFSHYIISDATFVWDDNYLNRTLSKSHQILLDKKISIFIGLANNDHLGELGITNRQWGNDFITSLKSIDNKELVVKSRYFPEEQHGTVMFLAFYYGLIDLFKNTK